MPWIGHPVVGVNDLQEFAPKVGGRPDVIFADEICEITDIQTTSMTDELG